MTYYAEIAANTCNCKIVLNGLGIAELKAEKIGSFQYPCNTELVGKANVLSMQVMPATIDLSVLNKIRAECVIKRYADTDMVTPDSGAVITFSSLQQKIDEIKANPLSANIAGLVPFTVSATFDSEDAPSFADRLLGSKPIKDKEALKDWAMAFRALLEKRDIDALYALYEPKLLDYDKAYPAQKEPDNRVWFKNWMLKKIFPQTPFTDFSRDEVDPVSWCEGRVWELRLKDGNPLWRTLGLDGKRTKIEVYAGLDDGKIKIVR